VNILVAAVLLNILAQFLPFAFDLTAGKTHSLSKSSKEIISSVNDIITVKAYISGNLPAQLTPLKQTVKNILDKYEKLSKGKIKISFYDPQKDPKLEQEALTTGITPLQFSSYEKDQFQMTQGFFGLAIFYADQKEIIPALQEINNLEYQITAAINKITKEKLPQIAFSQGLGETESEKFQNMEDFLQSNYKVAKVSLTEKEAELNKDIAAIIVVGAKEKLSSKAKFLLDQYLMNGKGVIILNDKVTIAEGGLFGQEVNNDLDDFLKYYGIGLEKSLIIDPSAALANFRSQYGAFIIPYPFWVKLRPENVSREFPPTAAIESAVFPWVSPLNLDKEAKPLLKTTAKAIATTAFSNLSPDQKWEEISGEKKQFVIAALQTKGFDSFFAQNNEKDNLTKDTKTPEFKAEAGEIKLAVVGDSNFIEDQTTASYPENAQFFMNLVDYLAADSKLIAIRSKTVFTRPLKMLDEKQKQMVRIINLVAGPVILMGIMMLVRIKRKKFEIRN